MKETNILKMLEVLGHPEYFEMLDFVERTLAEKTTEHVGGGKIEIAYSRFDHTKRVLAWSLRLYERSERKDKIDLDSLIIATIFHDVGRAVSDVQKIPHSTAGVPITKAYLEKKGYAAEKIDYVCSLVAQHSDKQRMKEEGLDLGFLMLMEADLLDDMGALGIVMDCMITESRNRDARFEDCFRHITNYTLRMQEEENPMVSPEGIAIWGEKTRITRQFIEALREDIAI